MNKYQVFYTYRGRSGYEMTNYINVQASSEEEAKIKCEQSVKDLVKVTSVITEK